ncbi:MAG: hypothetical protein EA378_05705 [Phycisphaerales bacterium]|nr:MAG: hypothetical protein EA378_05705 [Phycisphaerales bacterium]
MACRRRAEAAEAKAAELEARVEELTSALASAERALSEAQAEAEAVEQRRESERLLGEAHAVDLETGLMLVETLLDGGGCDCPREAVERLRQEKPFLFTPPTEPVPEPSPGVSRGLSRGSPSGMSAMGSPASSVDRFLEELEEVASHARESGDRRELLRYLRLRRGGG